MYAYCVSGSWFSGHTNITKNPHHDHATIHQCNSHTPSNASAKCRLISNGDEADFIFFE